MRMPWQQTWAPAAAFAALAVVGGIALNGQTDAQSDKLYKSQIEACERQNLVRAESNRRIEAHAADRDALRDFMSAARTARVAAYERDHNRADLEAATEYKRLIAVLDEKVTFKPVEIVNCQKVVRKP